MQNNPTKSESVILVEPQSKYLLIMLQKCYKIYDTDIFICKSLHRPPLQLLLPSFPFLVRFLANQDFLQRKVLPPCGDIAVSTL